MFRLRIGISLIAIVVLTVAARATPVTFSLQGGTFYNSGAKMTGTVVIDTTTGVLVSADLTYALGGSSVTFNQAFVGPFTIPPLYTVKFPLSGASVFDGPGDTPASPVNDEFDLVLPVASLIGYSGGLICNAGDPPGIYCGGGIYSSYHGRVNFLTDYGIGAGIDDMGTGELVPLAVATPEPSEFALTLTGTALCLCVALRRFRQAQTQPS